MNKITLFTLITLLGGHFIGDYTPALFGVILMWGVHELEKREAQDER